MSKSGKVPILSSVGSFLTRNSPEILLGVGIAGMVTTTIIAVKATPKAMALVEEEKLRRYKETDDDTMTNVEIVKTCWKCYAPAVILCAVSAVCLVGSRNVGARRTAALAAAYRISETALAEYREKVIETIGEKKEKQVRDKIAEDQLKQNPVSKSEIIVTRAGTTLCFDPLSGRHFQSDQDRIKRAENELNRKLNHGIEPFISLNQLYDEIGLEHMDLGDGIGWTPEYLLNLSFSAQLSDTGEPEMVIDYINPPKYDPYGHY